MTSVAKATAATALTLSALVDTETADAADVSVPFGETEDNIDEARQTVSVTANDTHVKNLADAIVGVSNQFAVTLTDSGADESLTLNLDATGITAGYAPLADGANGWAWGNPGGGGAAPVDVEGVAGENLALRDLVYFQESDGEWYKIDTNASPPLVGYPRGVVTEAAGISSSSTGTIRIFGEVSGFTGLTAWDWVYASTTAGGYTQTRPTLTSGGGQLVLVPIGLAVSTSIVLVLPGIDCRFAIRDDVAEDGTLTVEHYADAAEQARQVRAFLSSNEAGASLTTYSSSNQDTQVALQGPAGAGGSTDINATGSARSIGGDSPLWPAQSFQVTAGRLSQIKATFGANTGTPTGTITWEIRDDDGGDPGTILDTGTHTVTPSSENTITVTGGSYLAASTTYWLVLRNTSAQGAGNVWNWQAQSTSTYANGSNAISTDSGASWIQYSTYDCECQITTSAVTAKTRLAQSFQIGSSTTVGSVTLYMRKLGTPLGDLVAKIYTNSGGQPGSLVTNATSDTVAESTLSTSYANITFTFSTPPSLTSSTTYWLLIETTRASSNSNYVEWGADGSAPSYASGSMSSEASSTWSAESKDAVFTVYDVGTAYDEPLTIGSWTLEDGTVAVRYDDGAGSDGNTNTTFKNTYGATLDLTCEVRLP